MAAHHGQCAFSALAPRRKLASALGNRSEDVVRLLALSGGFEREEACQRLARNHGMIASFSRALLEGFRHDMADSDFDERLSSIIDAIYQASVFKD